MNQSSPEQATFTDDDAERTVSVYRLPKYDLTVLVSTDVARQMAPDRTRKHIVLLFAVLFPLLLGGGDLGDPAKSGAAPVCRKIIARQ
jgi:hypothetical protein